MNSARGPLGEVGLNGARGPLGEDGRGVWENPGGTNGPPLSPHATWGARCGSPQRWPNDQGRDPPERTGRSRRIQEARSNVASSRRRVNAAAARQGAGRGRLRAAGGPEGGPGATRAQAKESSGGDPRGPGILVIPPGGGENVATGLVASFRCSRRARAPAWLLAAETPGWFSRAVRPPAG